LGRQDIGRQDMGRQDMGKARQQQKGHHDNKSMAPGQFYNQLCN